jgi:hypothetical protein
MVFAFGAAGGCGAIGPGDGGAVRPTPLNSTRSASPFGQTLLVDLGESSTGLVRGYLESPGAILVYDIGPVAAGDRLIVDVAAESRGLDPALAVFDENQNCMFLNDDRSYYGGKTDPYARFVSRRDTEHCYVVVSTSPRSDSTGEYSMTIRREAGAGFNPPADQVVYLNFHGASDVVIGNRAPVDVPPFSGSAIDPMFESDTEAIIALTVERVRQDYLGYDVTIYASSESVGPGPGDYTTVHMGSFNPSLLGIADSVDAYNERQVQKAIVFVDTFAAFMPLEPTVQEIADALANVTSHEIGHLLGLQHTEDPLGIMDTTASLRQMLAAQSFRRSALHQQTFVAGWQDARQLLLEAVGGDAGLISTVLRVRKSISRDPWYDEGPIDPARAHLHFSAGCAGQE